MKIVKQTVECTSGMFKGKILNQYITCYNDKQVKLYIREAIKYGSLVKLIKSEIITKEFDKIKYT